MQYSEVDLVGSKIISAGYCYGNLTEIVILTSDGKKERISFGVQCVKFDELKKNSGW